MLKGTRFGGRGSRRTRSEWIGGQLTPPFFITDREEPYRPEMIVWMEAPSGLVVGQEVVEPENAAGAVVRVLRAAMEQPLAGPPRRPDTIRVSDALQAAEIRATVGDVIPVRVAPTPELDQLLELMLESPLKDTYGVSSSYLEGGRIASSTVGELFAAGRLLYGLAPWKTAADSRLLRMDIPALNIDGACISIIGHLGESRGVLIFPSLAGYEAFLEVAEKPPAQGRLCDFGTGWLAFCFERGVDLPPSMRREVESHGWPIAGTDAYPRVERREVDGASRPLVERDLKIAIACANSLCALLVKHTKLFEADEFEPLCESYFDEHDLEVRFTLPYEAFKQFEIDDIPTLRPAPMAEIDRVKVGRNDPCPCGSGRKYKKCHLRVDEQGRSAQLAGEAHHDLDRRLVEELTSFAITRFAPEWFRFKRDFADPSEALQLSAHWSIYHYRVQGTTVADWFLEERGRRLPPADSAWLVAQLASWLSVWEVIGVEPGAGITVRDLLSRETRKIREKSASRMLVVRDAVLGRVVERDGVFLLCGVHPRPLPPFEAAEVVRRARGRLRRKRAVSVDRLRDEAFGRYLIRRWEEVVVRYDARCAIPPELQNTDGEALLLTVDHFKIVPGASSAVAARLVALDDVELQEDGADTPVYVFVRSGNTRHASWESTLIGRAVLADRTLRLETNSQRRADELRLRVESACGDKIQHRAREHTDPLSSRLPGTHRAPQVNLPPAELEQLLLEHKQRHYADWIDHALPALDGKSPRETARTPSGRAAVDVLLKDMENREQRAAGGAAFDFAEIRRRLRLE